MEYITENHKTKCDPGLSKTYNRFRCTALPASVTLDQCYGRCKPCRLDVLSFSSW